jgi:hypothetical protein
MRFSDLKFIISRAFPTFTVLANGVRVYPLTTAVTANVTTTTAPAGSIGITSHATGRGTPFYSDGAKWQVWVTGATTKASGAEINTGTDDAKFATAKAIADADAAKAAATPVSLDVFYFRTAAGVVKKVTLADLATAINGELNP